jgi:hypothetical protein
MIKANDELIDNEIARFEALAATEGLDAARNEFISRLENFRTRAAFELYQRLADQVVAHDRQTA